MSYVVTVNSLSEVISDLAEENLFHRKLLSCANVKIGQKLCALSVFVGKEPPTNNAILYY